MEEKIRSCEADQKEIGGNGLCYAPGFERKSIFLGMVTVMGGIAPGSQFAPEKIAEKYWELYTDRSKMKFNMTE